MKINISKSAFIFSIAILFSGCFAVHNGYMTNSAALSSANFNYVKHDLKGQSTATYIFGIGGLAQDALVDSAKRQMLISSPLKNNQTLVNLTVNFKSSFYFGVYRTVTCTITADVVEFINQTGKPQTSATSFDNAQPIAIAPVKNITQESPPSIVGKEQNSTGNPAGSQVSVSDNTAKLNDLPANLMWVFRNYNEDAGSSKIASDFNNIQTMELTPIYVRSRIKYNSELKFLALLILAKAGYSFDMPKRVKKILQTEIPQSPIAISEATEVKTLKNLTQTDLNNLKTLYNMIGSLATDE